MYGVLFSLCQVLTELIVLQHLSQYAWKYKIKAVRAIFFSKKERSLHGLKAEMHYLIHGDRNKLKGKIKGDLMLGLRNPFSTGV